MYELVMSAFSCIQMCVFMKEQFCKQQICMNAYIHMDVCIHVNVDVHMNVCIHMNICIVYKCMYRYTYAVSTLSQGILQTMRELGVSVWHVPLLVGGSSDDISQSWKWLIDVLHKYVNELCAQIYIYIYIYIYILHMPVCIKFCVCLCVLMLLAAAAVSCHQAKEACRCFLANTCA